MYTYATWKCLKPAFQVAWVLRLSGSILPREVI